MNVALVDPAAAERALQSYRELASLDASAVFSGSRAAADVDARGAAVVALVFLAGATLAAVAVSIP